MHRSPTTKAKPYEENKKLDIIDLLIQSRLFAPFHSIHQCRTDNRLLGHNPILGLLLAWSAA
jgi:hypothetical protein